MTPNFTLSMPVQQVVSHVMEDMVELTLEDLCRACAAASDIIIELVEEGLSDDGPSRFACGNCASCFCVGNVQNSARLDPVGVAADEGVRIAPE